MRRKLRIKDLVEFKATKRDLRESRKIKNKLEEIFKRDKKRLLN